MTVLDGGQWLGPGMILPQVNAVPPGGRACGAVAGQLVQAVTVAEIEAALTGDWREEELFVLRQSLENYRHLLKQMESCEDQLEKALAKVVANPATVEESERPKNPVPAKREDKPKRKKFKILKAGTGLKRDLRPELKRICGVAGYFHLLRIGFAPSPAQTASNRSSRMPRPGF